MSMHTTEIEHKGRTYSVALMPDESHGYPWVENDGHGPVSERRYHGDTPDKSPGELILYADRRRAFFYEFQEACKIALRDGWGAKGDEGMTARQKAAHAARTDFEYLRRYLNDQWSYVGVVVTALDSDGEPTDESGALWGIESDADEYLEQVARDLADEISDRLDCAMAAEIAASRPDMQMGV